ncbi:MAG: response regulator transcription factor [Chitinophagaceae bacterium]|nr:response regulator transcription factor [Chitinophagaceae bacterium]
MKIKSLIIDDEPLARVCIENYAKQINGLEVVCSAKNIEEAKDFLKDNLINLIFLDIEMQEVSGLDFIRGNTLPPVVIITAYPQHALEGFELDVIDYLVKPVSFERFYRAFSKVKKLLDSDSVDEKARETSHLFIRTTGKYEKVNFEDVLYVQSMLNYVKIITKEKTFITYSSLKSIEERLPASAFIKIHKSYLVSKAKISAMEGNSIHLGKIILPVSRNLKEDIYNLIIK